MPGPSRRGFFLLFWWNCDVRGAQPVAKYWVKMAAGNAEFMRVQVVNCGEKINALLT